MGKGLLFKVDITLEEKGLNEDEFNALITLIHEYKNVRSKLESIVIWLINRSPIPVIGSAMQGGKSLQYCLLLQKASASHLEYF